MRNILIPIDFSDNSMNAAKYAIEFFGVNAHYVLIYSVDADYRKSVRDISDKLIEFGLQDLNKIKNELIEDHGQLNIDTKVHLGVATSNILDDIVTEEIGCVVMGTTGKSGLERTIIGSVAETVTKEANVPVLLIPPHADHRDIQHAVFAADFEKIEAPEKLSPVFELCKEYQLELMIVHVVDDNDFDPEEANEQLALHEYLHEIKHSFHRVKNSDIASGINSFVEENEAELLIMLSRKHGFFHRVMNPSITNRVALHANMPILVLHEA